jgi:hypothetical protein
MTNCEWCGKEVCECEVVDSPIVTSVKRCHEILDSAKEYGLEVEVVVWALEAMRMNPGMLPEEALMEGYDEWIK